jgi:hypothetical protein
LRPESGNTPDHGTDTSKITVCRRLGANWHDLADYFRIPSHERARFERGLEPQGVWEWLETRARLPELREALTAIDRADLLEFVLPRP